MKIVEIKEVSYLTEVFVYCKKYGLDSVANEEIKVIKKLEKNSKKIECIENTEKLCKIITKEVKPFAQTIHYYFDSDNIHQPSLGDILLVGSLEGNFATVQEYKEYLLSLDTETLYKNFMFPLFDEMDDDYEPTLQGLLELMTKYEYRDERKIQVIDLFLNWGKHLEQLSPVLTTMINVMEKNRMIIDQIHGFAKDEFSDSNKFVLKMLNECDFNIKNIDEKTITISSSVFFIGIIMMCNRIDDRVVIIRGSLFDFSYMNLIEKQSYQKEDICEITKALSDPSKVEILSMLAKGRAYGKEIVDSTGLTPATISYHTSVLNHLHFVNVTVDSNKTYYELNRENIIQSLNKVISYFNELK